MPIYNGGGGVAGITVESDPTALKMDQNLGDLLNASTARDNLGVYSDSETDSAISGAVSGVSPSTLGVYTTAQTDSAISYALGSYTPPAPSFPVIVQNDMYENTYANRGDLKDGVLVNTYGQCAITLDASAQSWQVGDRFMIASTGNSFNINTASYNTVNGNSTHTINQSGVHWVCLVAANSGNYYWVAG